MNESMNQYPFSEDFVQMLNAVYVSDDREYSKTNHYSYY